MAISRHRDKWGNIPKAPEFLLLFKNSDEIARRQVYSYPALYRLMELGMITHHKGPTRDGSADTYRITEAGKNLLGEIT